MCLAWKALPPLASTNALLQNKEILVGSPHTISESTRCTSYQNLAPYSEGEVTTDGEVGKDHMLRLCSETRLDMDNNDSLAAEQLQAKCVFAAT